MPKSMTGFGRSEVVTDNWSIFWEVKSVNSRFLDMKLRAPSFLRSQEAAWEKIVREYASRGRVDMFLNIQIGRPEEISLSFNRPMAVAMINEMSGLAESMGHTFTPDFNRLLNMSMLWNDQMAEPDEQLVGDVEEGLRKALESWNRSREQEGNAMTADLTARVATLKEAVGRIAERVPAVRDEKIKNLREKVQGHLEALGAEYTEDRMLQEIVILSDKLDVSEEMTRLATHLDRLTQVLTRKGEIGKRLDFLLQETFREINTCGNKAQDSYISRIVVDFKAELEKCREQVQNIE